MNLDMTVTLSSAELKLIIAEHVIDMMTNMGLRVNLNEFDIKLTAGDDNANPGEITKVIIQVNGVSKIP